MEEIEEFLKYKNLSSTEFIDDFLELSDYTRKLIRKKEYKKINKLLKYILSNNYFEAFSWIISLLQEKHSKENNNDIEGLLLDLGGKIYNYNEFINVLGVNTEPYISIIKPITGKYEEIESFYNIVIYKTDNEGVYLTSVENFDNQDNDFIEYKLLFAKCIEKYVDNCDIFLK